MSVTRRESILRRNPYRDRRSFVARAMGLSPIGDIASGGLSESTDTTETITWETETDWDSATSEADVIHPSGVIKLGLARDSFETYSTGSAPPAPWDTPGQTNVDVSSNSPQWGSQTVFLGLSNVNDDNALRNNSFPVDQYTTFEFAYNEPRSSQTGVFCEIFDDGGNSLAKWGTDNPQVTIFDDSGRTELLSSPSPEYNEWRKFTITIDWANGTFDVLWEDVTGSSPDQSATYTLKTPNNGNVEEVSYRSSPGGAGNFSCDIDISTGILDTGSITTATKSFSSTVKPDLQNLSYSLNSQSITLDVIGSPGSGSEEIVSQALDGSTSHSLTWSNSHTDFRVKPNLTSSDNTTTPTIGRAELVG